MSLTYRDLRNKCQAFYEKNGHKEVPPIPLVPQNDPTTLFTGSGMQQLVPYLLGETHPLGTRLYNIQPCIRAQDIEEVGDNRHDTFFEMIGNWSLGDYFKKEQLTNLFTFVTDKENGLGLDPHRLYVTAFEGNNEIEQDKTSVDIWKDIFASVGMKAEIGERIFLYDAKKNWWSRAGVPSNMPAGEPGGPDSELFYQFDVEHDPAFGPKCHPNCDCGRFLEIGNSVFMQYKKTETDFEELPKMNVDFGGGLERFLAAAQNDPDVFKTAVFADIISAVEKATHAEYTNEKNRAAIRIIADHFKTAVFIIKDGVYPSNKEQGYVLRRLLRRALVKIHALGNQDFGREHVQPIVETVIATYDGVYFDKLTDLSKILPVIEDEIEKFKKSLRQGMKEIEKIEKVDGKIAFDLYQTYGFPLEITEEILKERGHQLDKDLFYSEFQQHKDKSRSSSAGKFKGGLADQSEQTIKYHTTTHLLHQALFDVLGSSVRQEGSNITGERLRFDFYSEKKPTPEDIEKVSEIINQKIKQALPVAFQTMPKVEAEKIGARMFFREKYPDQVNVYYVGKDIMSAYSKEFCGGPHVANTKDIGSIEIQQYKSIGSNLYRIYAK
ncbi:MAG: alanine--tRNA ligase [Candidatus Pacebacteria bacterium]|nr:alanine--tRNA ligase [Candidatus Paceibacterota bacterium]